MNVADFTYLLNKPDAINERQSEHLDNVIELFPYFQSARVLRLKQLYNQDSYRYNNALRVAAAFTTDRSVLFDFITSPSFKTVQNGYYEQKLAELLNIIVIGSEVVVANQPELPSSTLETSIRNSIRESGETEPEVTQNPETKLEIGKPLSFETNEKHSFQEWLQLSRFKPIERVANEPAELPSEDEKRKKLELIDRFIENNPKITPVAKDAEVAFKEPVIEDKSYLMTETLARVYLEQKKYSRAIQAYEILILKYPEKSSFFADRISEIKKLQQNNN